MIRHFTTSQTIQFRSQFLLCHWRHASSTVARKPSKHPEKYTSDDSSSTPITASTIGKGIRWKLLKRAQSPRELFTAISSLSKSRLATLVVLTTMSGYAMSPLTCTTPPSTLLYATVGTGLCIASANTYNQWMEYPYDAQMSRTRSRPCVKGSVTPAGAFTLASAMGLLGTGVLYTAINPITALLGALNIGLYAGVYTPMKRTSTWNTWIGSIVGGIPPVMGWTAVTGYLTPTALLPGLLLYAWQFPHFNALSYSLREDYSRAGYQMLVLRDPAKNALVSLRYSLMVVGVCVALTAADVTSMCFLATSAVPNTALIYYAWNFYRHTRNESKFDEDARKKSAKRLFACSLFHLPAVILLMLLHKRQWPHAAETLTALDPVVHEPFGVKS